MKNASPDLPSPALQRPAARDRDIDLTVARVADTLEEEIVLGALHPRERLVEDDLCERFVIKRHVTRLVLAELEQRGLVERRKNVGALVKSYTPREVMELYSVREILETSAASRIKLPVPPEQLAELVEIQQTHDAAAQTGDLRGVFRSNMAFHRALFALSDNQALTEAIREYERRTHAIRSASLLFPHYLEKARSEHHEMLKALAGNDQGRLVELCRDHLVPARDAYLDAYHRRAGTTAGANIDQ
ncbi:GntR family transcriptional regulator [Paraburkholderia sp. A1RI_3L]|jgi:DNA-binding GntR family transcriptional regulator|uniref:GntR family transcriptional regulator n=1 Tax=Paraburkholderia TaxID=1822464 RepID=UPI00034626CE|nr:MULTISPECIES: FCD domain-containing protein [Paraburkholderia]WEY42358.1 GntR family transcriptional regulator [Paraburkholderia sp. SUR17]